MIDGMATPWDRLAARLKRLPAEHLVDEHGLLAGERIEKLQEYMAAVEREIDEEIIRCRAQGASWPAVGRYLGMSKQGAQQRWRIAMVRTGREPYDGIEVPRRMADMRGVKHD